MAFDATIADQLSTLTLVNAQQGTQLNNMIDRNLTQGLGGVNTSLIHANGAVSDDPQLMAALQTASRSPAQGQTPVAG